jgi:hypothetical protein
MLKTYGGSLLIRENSSIQISYPHPLFQALDNVANRHSPHSRKIKLVATLSTPPPHTRSQFDLLAPLRLWHLSSLDAPTVAVSWTLAFAWAAHVNLPIWVPIALALAAWSVYIGDRLLDARIARTPLRARHRFHWKHRRIFLPVAIAAGLGAIAIALHSMPTAARTRDSVLAVAALAYFASVHNPRRLPFPNLRLPKELLVGILFTLACATPAWVRAPSHHFDLLLPNLIFIVLAWLNCHAIEAWESQPESRPAQISQFSATLAVIALLSAAVAATFHHSRPAALLATVALSAALLALLDQCRHRLTPIALRAAADLVLLTPLVLLVFPVS